MPVDSMRVFLNISDRWERYLTRVGSMVRELHFSSRSDWPSKVAPEEENVVLRTTVEAMGLEPTNLLTASQALYQLSYAPEQRQG